VRNSAQLNYEITPREIDSTAILRSADFAAGVPRWIIRAMLDILPRCVALTLTASRYRTDMNAGMLAGSVLPPQASKLSPSSAGLSICTKKKTPHLYDDIKGSRQCLSD
jgi:hypothetical protein